MRAGLVDYETSHGVDVNYKEFALVLSNDTGDTSVDMSDVAGYNAGERPLTKYCIHRTHQIHIG